jgi:hypothetical protein
MWALHCTFGPRGFDFASLTLDQAYVGPSIHDFQVDRQKDKNFHGAKIEVKGA